MELLNQLAQSGLLGLLLTISLLAIFYLYRENKTLQEKRLQDLRDVSNQVLEPLKSVKLTVESILTILNREGNNR